VINRWGGVGSIPTYVNFGLPEVSAMEPFDKRKLYFGNRKKKYHEKEHPMIDLRSSEMLRSLGW
jgi:hypothetical protein